MEGGKNLQRRSGSSVPRAGRLPRFERRAQILEEASRLFAERGFRGATTKDLAAHCGITEGIIYRHFESKETLFRAVLDEKIQAHNIDDFLTDLPSELSIEQSFEAVALRILEIGLADPLIHKLLLAATFQGSPETHRLYIAWRIPFVEYILEMIRSGIERGELRTVDPLITARAFVGLVMDCVLNCNLWSDLGHANHEPVNLVRNTVPIFVRGLMRDRTERDQIQSTNPSQGSSGHQ